MSYIFGKLCHSAIIWPIRKPFQCILQGVRFWLANHTRPSPTSDNDLYIYSICKVSRNSLLNHLWWLIYVRFENCEIPIDSQSVVPQPSPPAKWRFDWEIGRIWDILASPCTKMSHSFFSFQNFIAFHLFGPPPKQCSNYPPFLVTHSV